MKIKELKKFLDENPHIDEYDILIGKIDSNEENYELKGNLQIIGYDNENIEKDTSPYLFMLFKNFE